MPRNDSDKLGGDTIRLRTNERGLPIALAIAPQALSVPPDVLARRILTLCEISARRAQVARRRELLARGFTTSVVDSLNLSTEDELRHAETMLVAPAADDDDFPDTWLRRR
jgi:hypothetical protein